MQLRRTTIAVLGLFVLVATTACGARLSDEQRAQAIAATQGGGGSGGPSVVGDDGEDALPADGLDDVDTTTGGDTGGGDTGGDGSGDATAGGDDGGSGTDGGGGCTPGSATGPGVTPTEIKVGNVSQLTGLVPRFGQTGVNGARAYFNMVNSQGGVCGRKLTLIVADDRFQSATNRAETEKLVDQVIAFVGSTTVVDEGGAPIIEAKRVADVSLSTSQPRIEAAHNFSPNPIDPNGNGSGLVRILTHFKNTYDIKRPAILYLDAATGVNQSKKYRNDFQTAGIPVAEQDMYKMPAVGGDYRVPANTMKDRGVDFIITVAEVNAMAKLAQAFGQVQYFPKVPFYGAQVYGQKFVQLAGPNANGTEVGLIFAIPEEKANNPAIAAFDTWYARTAPGADADFFALLGWTAADMFVTALRNAGPDPTQAKIVEQLRTFTSYDGNGLVAPINPAQKKTPTCFHIVEVVDGKWRKKLPAQGFQC